MLNPKSDISSSADVKVATSVFSDKTAAFLARTEDTAYDFWPGSEATQFMPGPTIHFISTMLENYLLYELCRPLPLNIWSLVCYSRLYLTNLKAFLVCGCE